MSEIVAAVLSVKLAYEERWLRARQATAAAYTDALGALAVVTPERPADREHVFHKFVLRVADRDAVRERLAQRGISTLVHYATTLSALPFAAAAPHRGGGERAAHFAGEVLSLPIHSHLRADEVARVCDALVEALPPQAG
jgi:dTDP-4-amino-4,6-dideoxygalactose transaminase